MASAPLLVAVDGGGSGSRALLATAETVLARVEAGPLQLTTMAPPAVRDVLDKLLTALARNVEPRRIAAICLGLAGAGNRAGRALVESWALERLPEAHRIVCRDIDLVLAAGSTDGTGVAAVAGTGAVVVARDLDGEERIADGRGPVVGDRGGGVALGLEAIRLVSGDVASGRPPPQPLTDLICASLGLAPAELAVVADAGEGVGFADIAALARPICELAATGEERAQRLVTAAATDLANSYRGIRAMLRGGARLPHLLAGGLSGSAPYRTAFINATGVANWLVVTDPVRGGLILAARQSPAAQA